jgi:hypothetical protein
VRLIVAATALLVTLALAGVARAADGAPSAGASAAVAPPNAAAAPAPPAALNELESVTVDARRFERIEREVEAFVGGIAPTGRHDSLARWGAPICPAVAGLSFDKGQFVYERVARVARDAGVPLAPADCSPNLLIVMTGDAKALLERWFDRDPRVFNRERGNGAIERTIRAPTPVRVLHNACSVAPLLAKSFAKRIMDQCGTGELGSRLTREAVRVIYSAIVVVDLQLIRSVEIGALSDYVAMVSLAQLRDDPEFGDTATILRLFDDKQPSRPRELTPWDRAFLTSLYATDAMNATQIAGMKLRMRRELGAAPAL